MKVTAADYVIFTFGGVRAAARQLGYSPSAVSRWRTTGGEVPTKARRLILEAAKRRRLPITADHLQYGATIRQFKNR